MTLKDVALRAGVSVSTVSRVINSGNEKSATKEVRDRIWQAVQECGYQPNKLAQSLKKGSVSNLKPAEVYILFARSEDRMQDIFFAEMENYVKEELLKQGMQFCGSYSKNQLSILASEMTEKHRGDAVIVLGRVSESAKYQLKSLKKKVICITLNQGEMEFDHVVSDGERGAEIAMEYLTANGHKKIAYVGEYLDEVRYRGYKNFLISKKMSAPKEYVINTSMTVSGGYKAIDFYSKLPDKPTALFCANDVTAIGAIKGLADIGLKVPEDISVISIDNIKDAESFSVPLTTVQIPLKEMACFAVKTLKDRLENGHKVTLRIFMPSELVVRDSVKEVRG